MSFQPSPSRPRRCRGFRIKKTTCDAIVVVRCQISPGVVGGMHWRAAAVAAAFDPSTDWNMVSRFRLEGKHV